MRCTNTKQKTYNAATVVILRLTFCVIVDAFPRLMFITKENTVIFGIKVSESLQ